MNTSFWVRRLVRRTDLLLQRHPRRLTAVVVTLLLGSGVTAFGVAPLAPDAADLPRSIVTQAVTPLELQAQLQALDAFPVELYRSDLTRASDTADSLLRRVGVDDVEAAEFLRNDSTARWLLEGRPGKIVQVSTQQGRLLQLVARGPAADADQAGAQFTRLTITRDALGLRTHVDQVPLASQVKLGSGTIRTSLFAAADESHLPDTVTGQLAELFANDIDFRRELRRGDTFTVLYEALTADGEPITWDASSGRVLAARFVSNGKTYDAVWFQDPSLGDKGGYFGMDGRSKTGTFLASPVAFSRVTSGFSMRMHPILHQWRAHVGVDFAAPTGTPVRCVGDGTVDFAGWQNGYGNIVIVTHADERETRYAHLSRISVKKGQHVDQGQVLGAVGATGWATGPHLHFEFRVNGKPVDPMTIARASNAVTLTPAARSHFDEVAAAARAQLAAAQAMASSEAFE